MTIKYHFYKCGREPIEAHRYYDHSTGVAGFLAPQERLNYLGYMTIKEVEAETPNKAKTTGNRQYINVSKHYNSRF